MGADKRNTNHAGDTTSAKGAATDPVTGGPVELPWVKGSEGDLARWRKKGLAKAASLAPALRGLARMDRAVVGHFSVDAEVLEFLASAEHPRLGTLGTSCPDLFLRAKADRSSWTWPPTPR